MGLGLRYQQANYSLVMRGGEFHGLETDTFQQARLMI